MTHMNQATDMGLSRHRALNRRTNLHPMLQTTTQMAEMLPREGSVLTPQVSLHHETIQCPHAADNTSMTVKKIPQRISVLVSQVHLLHLLTDSGRSAERKPQRR